MRIYSKVLVKRLLFKLPYWGHIVNNMTFLYYGNLKIKSRSKNPVLSVKVNYRWGV